MAMRGNPGQVPDADKPKPPKPAQLANLYEVGRNGVSRFVGTASVKPPKAKPEPLTAGPNPVRSQRTPLTTGGFAPTGQNDKNPKYKKPMGSPGGSKAPSAKFARAPQEHDPDGARELENYITSHAGLYARQHVPIIKNLMEKKAAGTYDSALAHKLFGHLTNSGAQEYHKEHGDRTQHWSTLFGPATRSETARSLRDSFETEAGYGNYDNHVPKKYAGYSGKNDAAKTAPKQPPTQGGAGNPTKTGQPPTQHSANTSSRGTTSQGPDEPRTRGGFITRAEQPSAPNKHGAKFARDVYVDREHHAVLRKHGFHPRVSDDGRPDSLGYYGHADGRVAWHDKRTGKTSIGKGTLNQGKSFHTAYDLDQHLESTKQGPTTHAAAGAPTRPASTTTAPPPVAKLDGQWGDSNWTAQDHANAAATHRKAGAPNMAEYHEKKAAEKGASKPSTLGLDDHHDAEEGLRDHGFKRTGLHAWKRDDGHAVQRNGDYYVHDGKKLIHHALANHLDQTYGQPAGGKFAEGAGEGSKDDAYHVLLTHYGYKSTGGGKYEHPSGWSADVHAAQVYHGLHGQGVGRSDTRDQLAEHLQRKHGGKPPVTHSAVVAGASMSPGLRKPDGGNR